MRSDTEIREWLRGRTIAIPKMTSAFLALQLYLGEFEFIVVPFEQIFDAVKSRRAAAGLIIHEGQLTYARSGFTRVIDLGEWWKERPACRFPWAEMFCAKTSRRRCVTRRWRLR